MSNDGRSESKIPEKEFLRVLLVEDNPDDVQLCLRVLHRYLPGIKCDVVSVPDEFVKRLHATPYDVILADYSLGSWTGMDALNLLQSEKKDIPFILVTGAL